MASQTWLPPLLPSLFSFSKIILWFAELRNVTDMADIDHVVCSVWVNSTNFDVVFMG